MCRLCRVADSPSLHRQLSARLLLLLSSGSIHVEIVSSLTKQPSNTLITRDATTFSKLGVQFLGLGYYTEQNTDGIPSFVHCSLLRNGNRTLYQKSWGGPSKFWGGPEPPTPAVVAPLLVAITSGQSDLTRSHRRRTWTVQSYSPGGANVHLI